MQATFVHRARRRALSVVAALAVTATCGLTLSQTTHAYAAGPSAPGSPTVSPSASGSPSASPSASGSPSASPSASGSPTVSPSASGSPSASSSASGTPSASPSGEPNPQVAAAAVAAKYAELGGPAGILGAPVRAMTCSLPSAPCDQVFEHGAITWNGRDGVAHVIKGAIFTRWKAHWANDEDFGYPSSDEICNLPAGGCAQYFPALDRYIVWAPGHAAQFIAGPIYDLWLANGAAAGEFGYLNEDTLRYRDGLLQRFAGAHVYRMPAEGGFRDVVVKGAFSRLLWMMPSDAQARLGQPLANETCNLKDGGCSQEFEGGRMYWQPQSGAHVVWGAIAERYNYTGVQNGLLGYPIGNETCGMKDDGCYQLFQNGAILWSAATGAWENVGAIRSRYGQLGAENGSLGYPTSQPICGIKDGGCYQMYQGGAIVWSQNSGAWESSGALRDKWMQMGAENGSLGYPTGPIEMVDGQWHQSYQHGDIRL